MKQVVAEMIFMAGIFIALSIATVCCLLIVNASIKAFNKLKIKFRDVHAEQVIGALMLIGLVILFMFYGPIIMF